MKTTRDEITNIINHVFAMGRQYESDCNNQQSGSYSDFYAPMLHKQADKIDSIYEKSQPQFNFPSGFEIRIIAHPMQQKGHAILLYNPDDAPKTEEDEK